MAQTLGRCLHDLFLNPSQQVPDHDLAAAISAAAGTAANLAAIGPGITYLIELPGRRISFFSQRPEAFPKAFYSLLDTATSWEELLPENERPDYLASIESAHFKPEARYRIIANRRGGTLPVVDYRSIVFDDAEQPIAIAGRLVDDSFRSVAFDALARRSWKEIANSMTRRYLHDFNNTIAGIYSLSELYAEPGSDPKSTAEAMGHIRDCSIRAQELTKKIRTLTTLETGEKSFFDLGELLREQKDYMEALLPKGAEIRIEAAAGQYPIHLDANAFRQAILHLTSNASDAAGDNATIALGVFPSEADGRRHAVIDFQDNGPGFDPADLEKATTAFYSTKSSDKHPGLGLSIVTEFAAKLGGRVELSNIESGARIRLVLPLLEGEQHSQTPVPVPKKITEQPATHPISNDSTSEPPRILIYTWEDIARHPLLLAMKAAEWDIRIFLEPGPLLLDLLQDGPSLEGVLIFKSPLDEKAEPLISELEHARNCRKVALIGLGENLDALSVSTKRICGMLASGSSRPSALLSQLDAYFRR